ncbi:MAG: hypothetical protein P4M11_06765 [Candidatus Pacebacteria bacterium]|nr:hypothetical protein [Candidatus Paceibacterota bacterium]
MRTNAFKLFDKDKSNDIDFKEFCYEYTTLLHGSMDEQREFVAKLFDLDGDNLLGPDDLRSMMSKKADETSITPAGHGAISARVSELLKGRGPMEPGEFTKLLEQGLPLSEVLGLFEIIPSPSKELEIIKAIFKRDQKGQQTCHIISFNWWNMWHLYVTSCQAPLAIQPCSPRIDDFCFFSEDIIPIYKSRSSLKLHLISAVTQGVGEENVLFHQNEMERPGEIDNSDLEGPVKGLLRDNLMVPCSAQKIV